MKVKDIDVIYKLKNQKHIVFNLWYSSISDIGLSEFRNYNSLYISVFIIQRHLN